MPEKHHYLPIFYQKRWAGADDGRVCVYSKPHKEPRALRRHPSQVGFEYDLYKFPGLDFAAASHLERQFFLTADNDAAEALSVLVSPDWSKLNQRLMSGWTRFVMSLIHRTPEAVKRLFDAVVQHTEISERTFEENYATLRLPDEPATYEEYRKIRPYNPAGIMAVQLIQKVIDSQFVGNHFIRMKWSVLTVKSAYPLLTSDRPIVMTNGISRSEAHVAIPIGPQKLFVAANEQSTIQKLIDLKTDALALAVNDLVVRQSHSFCIGTDDRQLRFFAKRFGERRPSSPTETKPLPSPAEMEKTVGSLMDQYREQVRKKTSS
jgi:Protein of unknown function (DUF4238)